MEMAPMYQLLLRDRRNPSSCFQAEILPVADTPPRQTSERLQWNNAGVCSCEGVIISGVMKDVVSEPLFGVYVCPPTTSTVLPVMEWRRNRALQRAQSLASAGGSASATTTSLGVSSARVSAFRRVWQKKKENRKKKNRSSSSSYLSGSRSRGSSNSFPSFVDKIRRHFKWSPGPQAASEAALAGCSFGSARRRKTPEPN